MDQRQPKSAKIQDKSVRFATQTFDNNAMTMSNLLEDMVLQERFQERFQEKKFWRWQMITSKQQRGDEADLGRLERFFGGALHFAGWVALKAQ